MNPVASGTPATDAYLDLRRLAAQNGRPFDELLQFYALEGFLTRLTESRLSDGFVLKAGCSWPPWGSDERLGTSTLLVVGSRTTATSYSGS